MKLSKNIYDDQFTTITTYDNFQNYYNEKCAKSLMFDLKKYRGIIFHDTEGWCKTWRKTDLWFGKWHEEYGKYSPERLKVSKLGLWLYPLIQSRKNMSLKFTLLRVMCYDNEEWCKIWRLFDLSFQNWHGEFD